jgi:predicted Zn-dependent peptidase
MDKNTHGHKLSELLGGNDTYNDSIHAVAFGGKSLGNALKGNKSNIENLTFRTLQKFQKDNFSTDRIVILGAGIDNHN